GKGVGCESASGGVGVISFDGFTEEEEEQLRLLPNREYLMPTGGEEEEQALLGLGDILFGYVYDHRTTCGDPTVESPWTIATLSPLLSWLEVPEPGIPKTVIPAHTLAFSATTTDDVKSSSSGGGVADSNSDVHGGALTSDEWRLLEMMKACVRRSLIFPYLRVWDLSTLLVQDVAQILAGGQRRVVLRCMLQVYRIMEKSEVHYLLNKLFIEDYCVWLQKVSESTLASFATRYAQVVKYLRKGDLGLDLERLEASAALELNEKEGVGEGEENPCLYSLCSSSSTYSSESVSESESESESESDSTSSDACSHEGSYDDGESIVNMLQKPTHLQTAGKIAKSEGRKSALEEGKSHETAVAVAGGAGKVTGSNSNNKDTGLLGASKGGPVQSPVSLCTTRSEPSSLTILEQLASLSLVGQTEPQEGGEKEEVGEVGACS
ncbi:unnamed protein product, partial [Choristocarpus tenellus]